MRTLIGWTAEGWGREEVTVRGYEEKEERGKEDGKREGEEEGKWIPS